MRAIATLHSQSIYFHCSQSQGHASAASYYCRPGRRVLSHWRVMRFALCGGTCDDGWEAGTGNSTTYGVRDVKLEVEAGYTSQDADDVFGTGGGDAGTRAIKVQENCCQCQPGLALQPLSSGIGFCETESVPNAFSAALTNVRHCPSPETCKTRTRPK